MKFGRRLEAEQEEAYRPYYLRCARPGSIARCVRSVYSRLGRASAAPLPRCAACARHLKRAWRRRYNELKVLLKTAAEATATERSEARDDARHIRAAINRRLTPSPADSVVRPRARARGAQPGWRASRGAHIHRIRHPRVGLLLSRTRLCCFPRVCCSPPLHRRADASTAAQEAGSRGGGEGDDCGTRFMSILEADLERAGKFVALQVEDIQLRARALAARAAAASAPAELDRIEGASAPSQPRSQLASRPCGAADVAALRSCGRRGGGDGGAA